jgi:hypothetical protein
MEVDRNQGGIQAGNNTGNREGRVQYKCHLNGSKNVEKYLF